MNTLDHVEFQELAAGYSLHALDEQDQQKLLEHLADCEPCRVALVEFEDTAGKLAYLVEPAEDLPDTLWMSIKKEAGMSASASAAALAEDDVSAFSVPLDSRRTSRNSRRATGGGSPTSSSGPPSQGLSAGRSAGRARVLASRPAWAAAAAAITAIVLVGSMRAGTPSVARPTIAHLTALQELARVEASPSSQSYHMIGKASTTATVIVAPAKHEAVLVVKGIAPLRGRLLYQLWTLMPATGAIKAVPGPIFKSNKRLTIVAFRTPASATARFAVTVEPGPGPSPKPTSTPLLITS